MSRKIIFLIAALLPMSAAFAGDVKVARKIPYANPEEIKDAVRKECSLEEAMSSYFQNYAADNIQVVDSIKGASGKVLDLKITGVWSMGGPWGKASVQSEGELRDGGKKVASFRAVRYTGRGGYGACSKLNVAIKVMAKDVAKWLENPSMDAALGDAKDK